MRDRIEAVIVHEHLEAQGIPHDEVVERAADTDIALGSDVMNVALKAYGQLKLSGRTEGLEPIRRELGARFAKGPRHAEVKAA